MTLTFGIIAALIVLGLFTGMLSGVVGIGGGIVLVPVLMYLFGLSQFQAQGTSLALLMFPVGVLGVMEYYKRGHVDFKVVGILAAGFVVGSFLGGKVALSLPKETIKKIFAILLILIAIKMLFFDKKTKSDNPSETKTISPD